MTVTIDLKSRVGVERNGVEGLIGKFDDPRITMGSDYLEVCADSYLSQILSLDTMPSISMPGRVMREIRGV